MQIINKNEITLINYNQERTRRGCVTFLLNLIYAKKEAASDCKYCRSFFFSRRINYKLSVVFANLNLQQKCTRINLYHSCRQWLKSNDNWHFVQTAHCILTYAFCGYTINYFRSRLNLDRDSEFYLKGARIKIFFDGVIALINFSDAWTISRPIRCSAELFINSGERAIKKVESNVNSKTVDKSVDIKCPAELWDKSRHFMWCPQWQEWAPVSATPLLGESNSGVLVFYGRSPILFALRFFFVLASVCRFVVANRSENFSKMPRRRF